MLTPSSAFPINPSPQQPQQHSHPRRKTLVDGPLRVYIHRASSSFDNPLACDPDGTWTCCACGFINEIYARPGAHPLGALTCECPHKPCGSCTLSGNTKPFLPIEEPAMVPLTSASTDSVHVSKEVSIPFGIVCPCCGLSWRARELGNRVTKTLRKVPSLQVNKNIGKLATPRDTLLRKSRSTMVLGNQRVVSPQLADVAKQAEYATVRFSGVHCTCGTSFGLEIGALCFQIVGAQVDENLRAFHARWAREGECAGWSTTEELMAKGHGTPVLKIRGVVHANPLRSCPVDLTNE